MGEEGSRFVFSPFFKIIHFIFTHLTSFTFRLDGYSYFLSDHLGLRATGRDEGKRHYYH